MTTLHYISTRSGTSQTQAKTFKDVLLEGLAPDGGLYVPEVYPTISDQEYNAMHTMSFAEKAHLIIAKFAPDWASDDLRVIAQDAAETFAHMATTPLLQIENNHFICELFHGPTLAFKDVAMQILVRLMDKALEDKSERVTIVGATSGDTGGAAIEAFKTAKNADIFIFYPKNRVSDVQRRMMTTINAPHVHAVEIDGTFDDCQAIVKALFNDHDFRTKHHISGVNSINWARIMAQIVYYAHACTSLGAINDRPESMLDFAVPTGNFGDIFAGFVGKKMGLPINKLIIATNENDILKRVFETGEYKTGEVHATTSPSMDIQVSSNFERMLFEALGRNSGLITDLMNNLKQSGAFTLKANEKQAINAQMTAYRASEEDMIRTMRVIHAQSGYVLDPHTAVAVNAVWQHQKQDPYSPQRIVTLATAHPAKFPDAVKKILGVASVLPAHQSELMNKKEHFIALLNDVDAVKACIAEKKS